ncbi:hypothetical protein [Parageobacillus genomosp. 1]|uniref:hypothetical protein n=1 Tax=Parageobacillus genomosp. 1 TaxID=1295642 RepID=UPI001640F3E6|nr:hypothetical protein [Parageobacillus genomosp. 1]
MKTKNEPGFSAGVGKLMLADWACVACPSPTANALRTNLICPLAFPFGITAEKRCINKR